MRSKETLQENLTPPVQERIDFELETIKITGFPRLLHRV